MKTFSIVIADLFIALAVTFMVAIGALIPVVQKEVLTYLDQTKTDKASDPGAPKASESAMLEVLYGKSGRVHYGLSTPEGGRRSFKRYLNVVKVLREERPQDLRLRLDRRVPAGIYEDIVLEMSKLNIRLWLSNDSK